MIVYHGSNSNFKKLRIAKELVRNEATINNEGPGIYFSTDRDVAMSYGKYLYTLEVNQNYLWDFRNKSSCNLYIARIAKKIYKELKIDILAYFSMKQLGERMYYGDQVISSVGHEIYMLLDNNSEWYNIPKYKRDRVYQMLRVYDRKGLKVYMFNYNINNIGVIKDVSEDIVRIVDKKKIGGINNCCS